MKSLIVLAALLMAGPAYAADRVELNSQIFVERQVKSPDGQMKTVREEPKLVVPGDKLVFLLDYRNAGSAPADHFVVTNPMPQSVTFVAADSAGADYSVDGGKTWGRLGALKVKAADGSLRPAGPADVTDVRWVLTKAIPVGGKGSLSFRGTVR